MVSGGGCKTVQNIDVFKLLSLRSIVQTWSSIVNSEFHSQLRVLEDWEHRLCFQYFLADLKAVVKATIEKFPLSLNNYATVLREILCLSQLWY